MYDVLLFLLTTDYHDAQVLTFIVKSCHLPLVILLLLPLMIVTY